MLIDPDLGTIWFLSGVIAMVWTTGNLAVAGESWSGWDVVLIAGAMVLGPIWLALLVWHWWMRGW